MAEKKQNKWEKVFDEYMEYIHFRLVKHSDDSDSEYDEFGEWSLVDLTGGNLGDIERERFANAMSIIDRLEIYHADHFVNELIEATGLNAVKLQSEGWGELFNYREQLSPKYSREFDYLEMICFHFDEIDLENCHYTNA